MWRASSARVGHHCHNPTLSRRQAPFPPIDSAASWQTPRHHTRSTLVLHCQTAPSQLEVVDLRSSRRHSSRQILSTILLAALDKLAPNKPYHVSALSEKPAKRVERNTKPSTILRCTISIVSSISATSSQLALCPCPGQDACGNPQIATESPTRPLHPVIHN